MNHWLCINLFSFQLLCHHPKSKSNILHSLLLTTIQTPYNSQGDFLITAVCPCFLALLKPFNVLIALEIKPKFLCWNPACLPCPLISHWARFLFFYQVPIALEFLQFLLNASLNSFPTWRLLMSNSVHLDHFSPPPSHSQLGRILHILY